MRMMALLARLLWEAVLLIGVVTAIAVTVVEPSGRDLLSHQAVAPVIQLCVVGLLASGLSLSLRVGAPNLAVGSLAAAGGVVFGRLCTSAGTPWPVALLLVLVGAAVVGLLVAAVVAVLRTPPWAVSLALALLISTLTGALASAEIIRVQGPDPGRWALLLTVLLGLTSIGVGTAMWTHTGVAVAARARRVADPGPTGGRRGSTAPLAAALVLSSVLAAGAGVVAVLSYRATTGPSPFGAEFLTSALLPVLIAATSLRSPRGVVTGIVLATALVVYGRVMFTVHGAPNWLPSVVMASLALTGLLVGRALDAVVERMTGGRPGTGTLGIARKPTGAG